eukprot:Opistho-2@32195
MSTTLAALRSQRRISQLELSLRVGVSQRHLSCIETGRSRASREMLLALLDALEAPLAERNQALLAAGYAPAYAERSLDQPEMAPVREALSHLLAAHDPAPALVMDGAWNLLMANRGLHALLRLLGVPPEAVGPGFNLLRACLAPGGLRHLCVNELEVCAALWQRASSEAPHVPTLRPLLEELRPHVPRALAPQPSTPLMHTRLRSSAGELSFFSAFTTFGTPLDVTLASLRVEHFFPADAATREALALAASD